MVATFKANIPYNSFLLIVYGTFLSWFVFFSGCSFYINPNDGILYKWLIHGLNNMGYLQFFFGKLIYLMLLFFQANILNSLANTQKLFSKPNYLTGMCVLLFHSLFIGLYGLSSSLFVSTSMVCILYFLCLLTNISKPKQALFNIGLLFGMSTLFCTTSFLYLLLLLIGLSIMRPFKLTEWIILILGTVTPYYFLYAYNFLFDINNSNLFTLIKIYTPFIKLSDLELLSIISISLILLGGIYFIQSNMRKLLVQSRNSWTIIYFYLLISLFFPFLNKSSNFSDWNYALMPISVLGSGFFYYSKSKWVTLITHWLLFILSVIIGYYYLVH